MTTLTAAESAGAVASGRAIEDLVRSHLPLVGHPVREMLSRLPAHVAREDLISAGMAALATAAKNYDPHRGTPFGSFATARIRGALLERLRHVVTAYFFDERPMTDIATQLGVTESRISQLRAEALVLLRDGLNNHLDPHLTPTPERPGGCVARRRDAYYAAIAARGNLTTRLNLTTTHGMPHPLSHTA